MIQATYNGEIIARSDKTILVEGNHYFPADSVHKEFLIESDTHSTCPWKGKASYKSVKVGDQVLVDACWYYPDPKEAAANIKGYLAFWKGVKVV